MMKKKHIIFDVDGTLVDSRDAILSSLQAMLQKKTGRKTEKEQLTFALGITGEDGLRQLGIPEGEMDDAMKLWLSLMPKYGDRIRIFSGIRELLAQLKERGFHLGIATSRTKAELSADGACGLAECFDMIICADDTERHKPSGDPVKEYLRRMNADPEDAVYIGDTKNDMLCAKDAGVEGALALWGCVSAAHIRADYYLNQPAAVLEAFGGEAGFTGNEGKDWPQLLKWAMELQFIAQAGLTYSRDRFDLERFERIRQMAAEMTSASTGESFGRVEGLFQEQCGYQTPKLDTRAALVEDGRILLVQESDGRWALPGGWVDEDQTIYENTVKEVREESGLTAAPVRLIALQDQHRRNTPPNLFSICKVFVLCEPVEGKFRENAETLQCGWFLPDELPELAREKTTEEQIRLCFAAAADPNWAPLFD